jgi:hypothetical protein
MTNTNEINSLKTLMEQGALTKEEYETLLNKINDEQKSTGSSSHRHYSDSQDVHMSQDPRSSTETEQPTQFPITDVEIRIWNSIYWSGKRIKKAISAQVIGFFSTIISFGCLSAGYIELFRNIVSGNYEIKILDNGWFVLAGIFGIITFATWIMYLTDFYSAGSELKEAFENNKPLVAAIKKKIKFAINEIHSQRKVISKAVVSSESGLEYSIVERYWHIYVTECNSLNKELKKS